MSNQTVKQVCALEQKLAYKNVQSLYSTAACEQKCSPTLLQTSPSVRDATGLAHEVNSHILEFILQCKQKDKTITDLVARQELGLVYNEEKREEANTEQSNAPKQYVPCPAICVFKNEKIMHVTVNFSDLTNPTFDSLTSLLPSACSWMN